MKTSTTTTTIVLSIMKPTVAKDFVCRVSSVLNNDSKSYGKWYMFDGNEETCWNSAEGTPQWIEILFNNVRSIKGFEFQFQGGFVGRQCSFSFFKVHPTGNVTPDFEFRNFYPEDTNYVQTCLLDDVIEAKFVRITFNESTDFYGRVTLYRLTIL